METQDRRGRHRVTRPQRAVPGPVTAASKVLRYKPKHRVTDIALRAWPALPALVLIWPALHGTLLRYADQVLGFDAVLALVACLAVTPVITVAKMPIAKLRWWYGIWVFLLGAAGLAIHLAYPPGSLGYRAAGNIIDWSGTLIVALLLPMAVTSSVASQKLMGPEWKSWQRALIWLVWAAIGMHLYTMHTRLALAAYGAATLPAVLVRVPWVRKSVKTWRSGGYELRRWWITFAVLGVMAISGADVLISMEVHAVASAVIS